MADNRIIARAAKIIARIVAARLRFTKTGPHPDSCVLHDPHCDCRMGQYCKRLPDTDDESEDDDES